jgi:hypothetical protein
MLTTSPSINRTLKQAGTAALFVMLPFLVVVWSMALEPLTLVDVTLKYAFPVAAIAWPVLALWQARHRLKWLCLLSVCAALTVPAAQYPDNPINLILVVFFIPLHVILFSFATNQTFRTKACSNKPLEGRR